MGRCTGFSSGAIGKRAWIYKEGTDRNCWVVETSWLKEHLAWRDHASAYARGYFDAEGGIPRSSDARFYVQYVQKDLKDLAIVRECLEKEGIACGSLHNPSVRVDPSYWRFYVLARSHGDFCRQIGSWHPRKRSLLHERLRRWSTTR